MLRDASLIPLSREHHDGLAFCLRAERSLSADTSDGNVARLCGDAVELYRRGLRTHFAVEEEEVFPVARPVLGKVVDRLVGEHRRMEALVGEMQAQPELVTLREFTATLRGHIRAEEADLFEAMQQTLPQETLDALRPHVEERLPASCERP